MSKEVKKNELSGREIVVSMFLGILVSAGSSADDQQTIRKLSKYHPNANRILDLKAMLLVFFVIKRQIIRFTLKNRRGPHYPIGLNAPKFLKKEIERRLLLTREIKTEPLLINGENQFHEFQSTNEGELHRK